MAPGSNDDAVFVRLALEVCGVSRKLFSRFDFVAAVAFIISAAEGQHSEDSKTRHDPPAGKLCSHSHLTER